MGKQLDKNKQIEKTRKVPIELNPSWHVTILQYKASYPDYIPHPAVQALEQFTSKPDATWDEQILYLKEADTRQHKSSKSAAKIETPAPPSSSEILSIIEPVICAAYFTAPEVPSRRHCIPIIDLCDTLLPNTHFLQEYDRYITHDTASFYSAQPIAQKALAIYTTLDFPLGAAVVRQRLSESIRYLVDCLGMAIDKAESTTRDAQDQKQALAITGGEAVVSQTSRALTLQKIMDDVQFTTKTLLALLSRHADDLKLLLDHQSVTREDRYVNRLLNYSISICAETNLYPNECGQLSGMTVAATLDLLGDPELVRDVALALFFLVPEMQSVPAKEIIQTLEIVVPRNLTDESGWFDDAPMLSVVRGLLANLRKHVLLTPLPATLEFLRADLISSRYPSNLHHFLFNSIIHFCSLSNLNPQVKIVAFETMAIWLSTTRDTLQESRDGQQTPLTDEFVDLIRDVLNDEALDLVLGYVWNLWDDPVDAIQHKVRTIFETLLEVVDIRSQIEDTKASYKAFLSKLLERLLQMDWHRKLATAQVKFALLSLLLPKISTDQFLTAQPDLVWRTLQAHASLMLAPRASSLLIPFLTQRWQETVPEEVKKSKNDREGAGNTETGDESQKREKAIDSWIQLWLSPLCRSLTSSSEVTRKNIAGHTLQPIFKICPESFWKVVHVLERRTSNWSSEYVADGAYQINALIAVVKAGRSLDLVEGDAYTKDPSPKNPHQISIQTLLDTIHHIDPTLRVDTLGLICESRKSTTEVTRIEIDLLRAFLPLNMNCTSPDFRQKFSGHITKFFTRLRGSIFAQYRNYQSRLAYVQKNASKSEANVQAAQAEADTLKGTIDYAHHFLLWLGELIAASLYPGSSYQRVSTALRLMSLLIKIFGVDCTPVPEGFAKAAEFPFQLPIATTRNVKLLLDCLADPFDGNRAQAYEILMAFTSPLPGYEAEGEVQRLLWWALQKVISTRAGESESGAIVFRLIFAKYVVGLGFDLEVEQKDNELSRTDDKQETISLQVPTIAFAHKLLNLLQKQIGIASTNLLFAAQKHPMHGTLLALQYLFRELDYNSAVVKDNVTEWHETHDRVMSLVNDVCATVMDVLSNPSPEGNVPASFQEMEETMDDMIEKLEDEDGVNGIVSLDSGPKHQIILSCCWRAVKEASALLGVILSRAPLAVNKNESNAFLDYEDIVAGGTLFQTLLTSIRHRGAFSAVYPSYTALCSRLLSAPQALLSELPSIWLQDHMANITSNNISVTRRSAGLPLCVLAIVSGEPANRKPLLTATMKSLVEIASEQPARDAYQTLDLPQVHAFNILRTIFTDAKLRTDVLPYISDGFSLAINGFSSQSWAVRNCSMMLFSTLLQRTFGTKKTKDEHDSMDNLTSREFFTRFPLLLQYLLRELQTAVKQLLTDKQYPRVHPGLYSVLTLLARLHPSLMDRSDTELTMGPFVPLVMSCASSSIFKTREMSARALVPLINSTNLVSTVIQILDSCSLASQNELHGRLVQVQFLLRGHLYNIASYEVMKNFATRLPDVIASKIDITMPLNTCDITRSVMLDIITEFFIDSQWANVQDYDEKQNELPELIAHHFSSIRRTVFNHCTEEILNVDHNKNGSSIGHFLLRQQMAKVIVLFILKGLSHQSDVSAAESIVKLLGDDNYEVRSITLEMLNELMFSGTILRYENTPQVIFPSSTPLYA
ncbi:hypothetical protein BC937DRAFT_94012 [Endogone sp. FLAS-F59071]|nr:hypothetical protein BC937DRAFT_94012 [Endogone sp. FLAS-F59071]|eukprot:RUS20928.1 hypothetical protein BC937DRAFT_94012 [Endogone sp. FLAS-F59071]